MGPQGRVPSRGKGKKFKTIGKGGRQDPGNASGNLYLDSELFPKTGAQESKGTQYGKKKLSKKKKPKTTIENRILEKGGGDGGVNGKGHRANRERHALAPNRPQKIIERPRKMHQKSSKGVDF